MAEHTPLPWAVTFDRAGVYSKTRAEWSIADCLPPLADVKCAEANAAYIVRACNSHYELLEALEEFSREYDGFLDGDGNDCPTLLKARAAIAKAKGGDS